MDCGGKYNKGGAFGHVIVTDPQSLRHPNHVAHTTLPSPRCPVPARQHGRSMPFEILHGALMLLRGRARREGAEIAPLACLRIFLARIEPVLAGGEFADHGEILDMVLSWQSH